MIRFLELPILAFDDSVAVINSSNIPTNIPEIDETVVKKHIILTEEMCANVAMVTASYPITAKNRGIHHEDICQITIHNVYQSGIIVKTIDNIPLKAREVMRLINDKLQEWQLEDIEAEEKFFEEMEAIQTKSKKKSSKQKQLPPPQNPQNPTIIE